MSDYLARLVSRAQSRAPDSITPGPDLMRGEPAGETLDDPFERIGDPEPPVWPATSRAAPPPPDTSMPEPSPQPSQRREDRPREDVERMVTRPQASPARMPAVQPPPARRTTPEPQVVQPAERSEIRPPAPPISAPSSSDETAELQARADAFMRTIRPGDRLAPAREPPPRMEEPTPPEPPQSREPRAVFREEPREAAPGPPAATVRAILPPAARLGESFEPLPQRAGVTIERLTVVVERAPTTTREVTVVRTVRAASSAPRSRARTRFGLAQS